MSVEQELASAVADLQARVSTPPRFGTVAFTFCSGTGNPVVTRVKQASNADLCGVEVRFCSCSSAHAFGRACADDSRNLTISMPSPDRWAIFSSKLTSEKWMD